MRLARERPDGSPVGRPLSPAGQDPGADEAVALRRLSKTYRSRGGTVAALRGVTLAFAAGSFTRTRELATLRLSGATPAQCSP